MNFTIFSKEGCPYCDKVKKVLELTNSKFVVYTLDNQFDKKDCEESSIKVVNKTADKIKQNRGDIFNNKVSGKGGGETSLQEEIAGISRGAAQQYPDDTPEQHKERIKK